MGWGTFKTAQPLAFEFNMMRARVRYDIKKQAGSPLKRGAGKEILTVISQN